MKLGVAAGTPSGFFAKLAGRVVGHFVQKLPLRFIVLIHGTSHRPSRRKKTRGLISRGGPHCCLSNFDKLFLPHKLRGGEGCLSFLAAVDRPVV